MGFWSALGSVGNWLGSNGSGVAAVTGSLPDQMMLSNLYNKKNATRAYRRQRAMYMLDYNLKKPSNQMALLKEAKLNPNLVYGESNVGTVNAHAPSVPQADSPSGGPGVGARYLEAKLAIEQIRNVQQSRRESESREHLNNSRQEKSDLETRILRNTGLPPNASAATRFYESAKSWAERAYESGKKWYQDFKREHAESEDARRYNDQYYRWRIHRRSSLPPVRATDRSLYDYLYDGAKDAPRAYKPPHFYGSGILY